MQTTVQSDAAARHLRAVHRTFVGFVVVAKTIEQFWCVLELMLVIDYGKCDIQELISLLSSPSSTSEQCPLSSTTSSFSLLFLSYNLLLHHTPQLRI